LSPISFLIPSGINMFYDNIVLYLLKSYWKLLEKNKKLEEEIKKRDEEVKKIKEEKEKEIKK
jgi:hypothetical protein